MTRVIAVANQKGGVGKSTTAAALGELLAAGGKATILLDLDAQANLTSIMGHKRDDALYAALRSYAETGEFDGAELANHVLGDVPGPYVLASSGSMAGLEVVLARQGGARSLQVVEAVCEYLAPSHDYIILDCPPSLGKITMAALAAASDVIIPVAPEPLPVEGMALLLQTVAQVRRSGLNPALNLAGVVPTMVSARSAVHDEMLERIEEICARYLIPVLPAIPRRTAVQQAAGMGKPITHYSRAADVARAYAEVAGIIIASEGGN